MLKELERYVDINTETLNVEVLNPFQNLLEAEFNTLGFETTLQPSGEMEMLSWKDRKMVFSDHLLFQRDGEKPTKMWLNGHPDTVFPKDCFQAKTVEADGTWKGPVVLDMKGVLVAMTYALNAWHHHGRLQEADVTIFLNMVEEIGSFGSRFYLEDLAVNHDVGLLYEESNDHKLARQRKGLGQGRIKVAGREAHAGEAHAEGASADLELSHKVIALEGRTNYDDMKTVNVGTIEGGKNENRATGALKLWSSSLPWESRWIES